MFSIEYILKCNWFLWCKAELSHDPSEIILICWFAVQETFLIIIKLIFFCGNYDTFFSGFFDE